MKRLKKFRPLLIMLLVVMLQFGTWSQVLVSYADPGVVGAAGAVPGRDVTQWATYKPVDLRETDGNDISSKSYLDGAVLPGNLEFGLFFDFDISDDIDLEEGDFMLIKIPDEIKIDTSIVTQPLITDGVVLANATYSDNAGVRTIKIVFTAEVKDGDDSYKDISGYFWFFAGFDESKFSDGVNSDKVIEFEGTGSSIKVTVDKTPPTIPTPPPTTTAKPTIVKSGTVGTGANWDVIDWTIKIDSNGAAINNWSISDLLGQYQGNISDVVVNKVEGATKTNIDSTVNVVTTPGLTIDFGSNLEGKYEVAFKTEIVETALQDVFKANKPIDSFQVDNQATLNYNSADPIISNKATVTIPSKLLTKERVGNSPINDSTDEIEWKITVNESGLSLKDVIVTDVLDTNMVFVPGSLTVTGASPTETPTYPGQTLTAKLGDITGQVTITYKTTVIPDYFLQNNTTGISNTANLTWGNGPTSGISTKVGIGVNSNVISKSGKYDASTGYITWTIIVNENKILLEKPTIIDVIEVGQKYVPNSYTVQKNSGTAAIIPDHEIYSVTTTPTEIETLSYYMGIDIPDTYTIKFKTLVLDDAHRATNGTEKYYNQATINSNTLVGKEQSTPRVSTDVTSKMLEKSALGYDYNSREITWEIELNQNAMKLEAGVKVTDKISKGLRFVEGSLKVGNVDAAETDFNFDPALEDENAPGYDPDYDSKYAGTLTYTFPGTINSTQKITFKTVVDDLSYFTDLNSEISVGNTAEIELTHKDPNDLDTDLVTEEDPGEQTITNNIVSKKAEYTDTKDFIKWIVDVNSNAVDLNKELGVTTFSLVDELSDGLELDTMSVELYKFTKKDAVTGIPTESSREKITLGPENVKYDAKENKFEFVFPGGVIESYPYELTFITEVTAPGRYSNSISLKGAAHAYDVSSEPTVVAFSDAGGGAGRTQVGKITINKRNVGGAPLAGAEFELIDLFNNVIKVGETDATGNLVFKGIAYTKEYKIRESKAPTGYVGAETKTFTLVDKNTPNTFVFVNEEIKSNLTFKKQDNDGNPLSGAKFGLFTPGDNPKTTTPKFDKTSDALGIVLFENIPYGKYDLYEIEAPVGYVNKTVKIDDVNVTADGVTLNLNSASDKYPTNTVTNELIKTDIIFKKTDGTKGLAGAEFTLYKLSDNSVVATTNSKADGTVEFKDVLAGTYKIRETNPPFGYKPNPGPIGMESITVAESNHDTPIPLADVTNVLIQAGIKFTKVESRNGTPLEGAVFGLFSSTGAELVPQVRSTSNSNGEVIFTKVGEGSYILKETSAPTGYALNTTEYKISVTKTDDTQTVSITEDGQADPVTEIINQLIEADVMFTKLSDKAGMQGVGLQGAKFQLKPITPMLYPGEVYEVVSDENGIVLFENIPFGKYELYEVAVPTGYNLLAGIIGTVDINETNNGLINPLDDQDGRITEITNQVIEGDVRFEKVDKANGKPLKNATFALYASDDTKFDREIATAVSDDNGIVLFGDVEYGDYTIIEVAPPGGYYRSNEELSVSIKIEGETINLGKFENQLRPVELVAGTIEVKKVNELGDPLAGAKFGLYNVMGTLVAEGVTNSSGIIRFSEVIGGVYTIKELEAPKKYVKSNQIETVTISSERTYEKFTFINERSSDAPWPGVTVQKVDDAGVPLAGVKFALYKATDTAFTTPIANSTTNASGVATFTNVLPGKYVVKEVEALVGYVLSNVILPVTVTDDEQTYNAGTVENRMIRNDIVVNKVNEHDEPLKGAEFGLYDKEGKLFKLAVSDREGVADFKGIPYGSYTLKELIAPELYEKSDEVIAINITIDGVTQAFTFVNKKVNVSGVKPDKPATDSNQPDGSPGTGSTETGKNDGTTNISGNKPSNQLPKTGDSISTMLWLFVGSGLTIVASLLIARRRTHKQ